MWTKRQLIEEAFGELAIAGVGIELSDDELIGCLRRLNSMMAAWEARGIRLGYTMPSSPDLSAIEDDSGIPDGAAEAVYLNLAIRRAAAFGKQLSAQTQLEAKRGYDHLLIQAAYPQAQQLPNTMPVGAGAKYWRTARRPFATSPDLDPLTNTQGGDMLVLPE